MRQSGILLHISSLPSKFGIGDLGPQAIRFADFLAQAHQTVWQILPLNPTQGVYHHSPYSSYSAFACNDLFISPELLAADGLLSHDDISQAELEVTDSVDFEQAFQIKQKLLKKAFRVFEQDQHNKEDYVQFIQENADWLEDYALFRVIKENISHDVWTKWPTELRDRESEALKELDDKYRREIEQVYFNQFIFDKQWHQLRQYCNTLGIQTFGDIPIYVTFDSVDVWAHPYLFKLDDKKEPTSVAGVPPDYFSETGQRWGNPVYDWERLKQEDFKWWAQRFKRNFALFDIVRIDHFRGLVQYWDIPAEEETAVNGTWADVPTYEFLDSMKAQCEEFNVVAEDLGIITDDVIEVMNHYQFSGMKILLFAFNGDMQTHPYLPHNCPEHSVIYTGTHDNNTTMGWYQYEATVDEKRNLKQYLEGKYEQDSPSWQLIQCAMYAPSNMAIIPIQDLFDLEQESRMNKPATTDGNWNWRMLWPGNTDQIIDRLAQLTMDAGRYQEMEVVVQD